MKILITGATGFIGSHLVPYLNTAHDVSVLDARTVSAQSPEWHSQIDSCEVLVHLAGRAHVTTRNADMAIYKQVNTDLTTTLAERLSLGKKHMVFISTSVVYGHQSKLQSSFRVDSNLNLDAPYAQSKADAEFAIQKISQNSQLSYTIIRPPPVYGPRVKANFLSMMKWVHSSMPLPLGGVQNLRSLVGVRNLTNLIQECITNSAAKNQIFNASDDQDISTTELLTVIARAMGKPARLVKVPLSMLKFGGQIIGKPRAYDGLCVSFQLDITATKQALGWTAPFGLEEEIANTVAWFLSGSK